MTNTVLRSICLMFMAMLLLTSCEKVNFNDETSSSEEESYNVMLNIVGTELLQNQGATRASVDITKVCTRLNFVFFQNGEKIVSVSQKASDSAFGTLSKKIDPGTYQLLIVGHSGKGNPAISSPQKIQFTNPTASNGTGFTDTFYYYGDLTVGETMERKDYVLKRATALFQLVTTDPKPSNVAYFHFYYTGGSGAFDATTGFGCVNSKQAVIVETDESLNGQTLTFNMYTFLHDETGQVNFTINAFDKSDNIVSSHEFDVDMERNAITRYKGNFFESGSGTITPDNPITPTPPLNQSSTFSVDTAWAKTIERTF